MFNFDVEKFLTENATKQIESIHIAEYVKCSLRYVQKCGKKYNVKFKRVHGRKEYIWEPETIKQFAQWINLKYEKAKNKTIEKPKEKQPSQFQNEKRVEKTRETL